MAINPRFRTTAPAVATYDFFDLASQTGYVTYYGCEAEDSSGSKFILTRNQAYSRPKSGDTGAFAITGNGGTDTHTFEVVFEKPFVINGIASVEYASGVSGTSGQSVQTTVGLYHYDGTTETQLGSSIVHAVTSAANPELHAELQNAQITVSNQLFKNGDTLRLKVEVASSASGVSYLWFDPNNYTDATAWVGYIPATALLVRLPIKIQQ